jgi:hypothetical protein
MVDGVAYAQKHLKNNKTLIYAVKGRFVKQSEINNIFFLMKIQVNKHLSVKQNSNEIRLLMFI